MKTEKIYKLYLQSIGEHKAVKKVQDEIGGTRQAIQQAIKRRRKQIDKDIELGRRIDMWEMKYQYIPTDKKDVKLALINVMLKDGYTINEIRNLLKVTSNTIYEAKNYKNEKLIEKIWKA